MEGDQQAQGAAGQDGADGNAFVVPLLEHDGQGNDAHGDNRCGGYPGHGRNNSTDDDGSHGKAAPHWAQGLVHEGVQVFGYTGFFKDAGHEDKQGHGNEHHAGHHAEYIGDHKGKGMGTEKEKGRDNGAAGQGESHGKTGDQTDSKAACEGENRHEFSHDNSFPVKARLRVRT